MRSWAALSIVLPLRRHQPARYAAAALSVAATLGWMAFTWVFLGTPDPPGPDQKGWWIPLLAHLFLFGVLGVLASVSALLAARRDRLAPNLSVAVVVGSGWGAFTELYQFAVPGRGPAADDWLVDTAGALLGGIAAWIGMMWLSRRLSGPASDSASG